MKKFKISLFLIIAAIAFGLVSYSCEGFSQMATDWGEIFLSKASLFFAWTFLLLVGVAIIFALGGVISVLGAIFGIKPKPLLLSIGVLFAMAISFSSCSYEGKGEIPKEVQSQGENLSNPKMHCLDSSGNYPYQNGDSLGNELLIALWPGKMNMHTENGVWKPCPKGSGSLEAGWSRTDADSCNVAPAQIEGDLERLLYYAQEIYGEVVCIEEYELQEVPFIDGYKRGPHNKTVLTYRCFLKSSDGYSSK